MSEFTHESVMVAEVLESLALQAGETVVDGTVGLAGHARRMAERIRPGGTLLGFDWDAGMLEIARSQLREVEGVSVQLFHEDYRHMSTTLNRIGVRPDAVLLDLGLNNAQLEDPSRGISFRYAEAPLDMRMDRSRGEPASALLNRASAAQIERTLWELGDEKWARRIAQVIVDRRKDHPLRTTGDLLSCIEAAVPLRMREKRIHFATRSFQAIRISVNSELDRLQDTIADIAHSLNAGGRMAVLSYHSGEDRAVKRAFRELPEQFELLGRKPVVPSQQEIARNPKSRSAKLRALRLRNPGGQDAQ